MLLQLNLSKGTGNNAMKDFYNLKFGVRSKKFKILIPTCLESLKNVIFFIYFISVSLKCYLLANRKCFRSISLGNLANKFEMDEKNIRKLTSKWLYNREIQGSINEKGFLILAQKKQSQMQKLCESLYNKLEDVRKSYEQVMEQRFNAPQENE